MGTRAVLCAYNAEAHLQGRVPSLLEFISYSGSIIHEDAHLDVAKTADGMKRHIGAIFSKARMGETASTASSEAATSTTPFSASISTNTQLISIPLKNLSTNCVMTDDESDDNPLFLSVALIDTGGQGHILVLFLQPTPLSRPLQNVTLLQFPLQTLSSDHDVGGLQRTSQ